MRKGTARKACPSCKRPWPASVVGSSPFAQALNDRRLGLGYTTRAAAKAAGVSHATFYRAESGRTPDVVTFATLCKWLGQPMDKMMARLTNGISHPTPGPVGR